MSDLASDLWYLPGQFAAVPHKKKEKKVSNKKHSIAPQYWAVATKRSRQAIGSRGQLPIFQTPRQSLQMKPSGNDQICSETDEIKSDRRMTIPRIA
ncbi:hypothetical protein CEXT_713791 [Caerostris extrusa]|uniref:Uncharacterized protein n=1 Tax=Caerostris extrusa TaxID=172846 RepID=A0AAV4UBI0_CAEEX|nr:hypothetical protein CEXT_713791 [Caerostris extrusa]